MILSKEHLFSDGQVVTSDAASTNVIDLGAPGTPLGAPVAVSRDLGKGRPIPIVIQLDADGGGTNPTLDVDLEVDTVENFASPKVVASAQQIAGGSAGDRVTIFYLPEGTDQRYMRLSYNTGGTTPSYTITAGIATADAQTKTT